MGGGPIPPLQQDDRAFRRLEQSPFGCRDDDRALHVGQGWEHDRERLLLAMLQGSQPLHRAVVIGPHEEVKSAEPFHGHNASFADRADGIGECGASGREHPAARIDERQPGPARRTGVRLRVEPAIQRVVVFALAGLAHHEALHRRAGPVVRQRLDDGEARAAVRAVGEGILEAAIRGIEDLAQAIVAGGDIRKDERDQRPVGRALADLEPGIAARVEPRCFQALDCGARRPFGKEPRQEAVEGETIPLDLDAHPLRRVAHPSLEVQRDGETVDKRSEADALHGAGHARPEAFTHGSPRPVVAATRTIGQCRRPWCTRSGIPPVRD